MDKKSCGSCGNEGKDVVDRKETYNGIPINTSKPTSYSPQLQQQIRYTQNGYTQYMQSVYPQTQASHARNQIIPLSQTQKPASPYPTQMNGQYIQNGMQQTKVLPQKNGYGTYYQQQLHNQLEQQHNQMNKQVTIQSQQNTLNQRIPSHNASPITVQHSQQQFYPPNQSPNPYQNQYSQSSYQGHPYQTVLPQNRANQLLPQYQPPSNSLVSYQQQQQQQNAQNYQQRHDNYQRQLSSQKIEQQGSMSNQYPKTLQNGQIQPNVKYPPYQHPPLSKQMHFAMSTAKVVPMVTQPPLQTQTGIATTVRALVTPCNLCRKRNVLEPTLYCTDCDFYMSRFRPTNKTT